MRLNPFRKSKKPNAPVQIHMPNQQAFDRIQKEQRQVQLILDRHFGYQQEIQQWYPLRDSQGGAIEKAVKACQGQIGMSKQAFKAWQDSERLNFEMLKALGDPPAKRRETIPRHVGFEQLSIIREKDGDYAAAIQLCKQAKKDGWAGDWDKRIARLEVKQAKARQKEAVE